MRETATTLGLGSGTAESAAGQAPRLAGVVGWRLLTRVALADMAGDMRLQALGGGSSPGESPFPRSSPVPRRRPSRPVVAPPHCVEAVGGGLHQATEVPTRSASPQIPASNARLPKAAAMATDTVGGTESTFR